MQIAQCPRAGDLVRVRRRRWRVLDVRTHAHCQLLTLAAAGGGDVRRILAPFDEIERVHRRDEPRLVSRRQWRRACRFLFATHSPPGALRTGRRARIDLLPHQLEPALAIIGGLGSRLLLADEVGLGKTIQAALVVSELKERGAADRVLIVTPAGLREQWAGELAGRFGLDAFVADARQMRRRQADLPVGVNPWTTVPVAIASMDYVKRPEILASVLGCRWDVLIVDEAHNAAGHTERHDAIAALGARCPYVLLLTATPHNGDRRAFAALCDIGAHGDPLLVCRRTRRDVSLGVDRRVHLLRVSPSPAERRMHALVEELTRLVRDAPPQTEVARDEARLALTVLNKRALSSAWALQQTVERRLTTLARLDAEDVASQLLLHRDAPAWSAAARRSAAAPTRSTARAC